MKTGLSKSRILRGLQCEKSLHLSVHSPALAAPPSSAQKLNFEQGHEVGRFAHKKYAPGILISASHEDGDLAVRQTKAAINTGALNIYEATVEYDGVLVKVDILSRASTSSPWRILEVKSSTKLKDVHVLDVAVQLSICRGSGLQVESAVVVCVNNKCVFPSIEDFFVEHDVTKEAESLGEQVKPKIPILKLLLASEHTPEVDIGEHCSDPYECPFHKMCWRQKGVPEISVFDVPRLGAKEKWDLYSKQKVELSALDASSFNKTQGRMIEQTVLNRRLIDGGGIKKALQKWKFPLTYLDFEAVGYAIPKFVGQRPYQAIPFQFSCHIQKKIKGSTDHKEYLHGDGTDPRRKIAVALLESIPREGSVVSYYMSYESGVIESLSEDLPDLGKALLAIRDRLVDPLPIIRNNVYDPAFKGSFSIKDVAPAILGVKADYSSLLVGDGQAAQLAFREMIAENTPEIEREKMRSALLNYCARDTLCMVELVDWLYEHS